MNQYDNLKETMISSEKIYDGRILHVTKDTVSLPNGDISTRELIRHVGACCVVPLMEDGRVIVERQFRYPLDMVITEIPAGKLDSKEEDRLEAAKRELLEETGITADEWINLGDIHPAAAYTDEKLTMYLAKKLHFGDQNLDEDEFLNIEAVPLAELVDQVMEGEITDSKTIAALLKVARLEKI